MRTHPLRRRTPAAALAAAGVLAVAVTAAGCGGAEHARSSPSTSDQPTATRQAAQVIGTPSARGSTARYGKLPSWLPKASVRVGRIVIADPARPRLAIEGDTVAVHLPAGAAEVTTVGPDVPDTGQASPPPTTPCRFVITLARVRGSVPLRQRAFSLRDEQGRLHHPQVRLQNGGALPARLRPGHPVTLVATAVLPSGGGQLRWAPLPGRPVVAWDFDVEID